MMSILEHSAGGATIRFDQRELLLGMTLMQEGRKCLACHTDSARALDEVFISANVLVEVARRRKLKRRGEQHKSCATPAVGFSPHKGQSSG
jgi:hypothetical protein